jgi:hypothetical protein
MSDNDKLKLQQTESTPNKAKTNPEDLYTNSKKDFKPTKNEDYGYFFFPERFGNIRTPQWYEKFFSYGSSRELLNKTLCEENVANCLKTRITKEYCLLVSKIKTFSK